MTIVFGAVKVRYNTCNLYRQFPTTALVEQIVETVITPSNKYSYSCRAMRSEHFLSNLRILSFYRPIEFDKSPRLVEKSCFGME